MQRGWKKCGGVAERKRGGKDEKGREEGRGRERRTRPREKGKCIKERAETKRKEERKR